MYWQGDILASIQNLCFIVPILEGLSWTERWEGEDRGLICCLEQGRKIAEQNPELAENVREGELPLLGWRGGVSATLKQKKKGTLQYLAQWQGIRGEPLDNDPLATVKMICALTKTKVEYSAGRGSSDA